MVAWLAAAEAAAVCVTVAGEVEVGAEVAGATVVPPGGLGGEAGGGDGAGSLGGGSCGGGGGG